MLAVYPASQAGTRLRGEQFAAALDDAGVPFSLWSFFDARSASRWIGGGLVPRLRAVLVGIRRLASLPSATRGAEIVIVLRQALPFGPPVVEWLVSRRRKLVWDVDDAVWEPHPSVRGHEVPQWLRAPGRKYERLCRRAEQVWAGNRNLLPWCERLNDDVRVLPTVVDVPAKVDRHGDGRVLTWIGSPSTAPFVAALLPWLSELRPRPQIELVGGGGDVPTGVEARWSRWSPETEAAALRHARVGLYPIDLRHPLAAGKSGFKAILYMAHGVPVVATPSPAVRDIVRDGLDGFHATTQREWVDSVQRLLDDDVLWRKMSETAHRRAIEEFSLERWAPVVVANVLELRGGQS